jgi:hypothetical protein
MVTKANSGGGSDFLAEAKEQPSAECVGDDYFMKSDQKESELVVEGQGIKIAPAESKNGDDDDEECGGKQEKGGASPGAKG